MESFLTGMMTTYLNHRRNYMDNEQMKAKARELIENAPEEELKKQKGLNERTTICSMCYFGKRACGENYDCIGNIINGGLSGCEHMKLLAAAELERRQTPEYKAQQALRAIPDDMLIKIAKTNFTHYCDDLSGDFDVGCTEKSQCILFVCGKRTSKILGGECIGHIKSEYARRFPNGHEKGEAMKIEIGKKYRVVDTKDGFKQGDIVVTEHDNYPSDVYFFKRISDGRVSWINKNNLAPIEDAYEYPLTLSQAIEAMVMSNCIVEIGDGSEIKYRYYDNEIQSKPVLIPGWSKSICAADYLISKKYRIVPSEPVTTTELVGMFGSHKVEVKRVDGKLVRDEEFDKHLKWATAISHECTVIKPYKLGDVTFGANISDITIGCQTVPYKEAVDLANRFIKIAEGE
jgi:hypothetical protein